VKATCKTVCTIEEYKKCYDDFKRAVASLASRRKISVLHGSGRRGILYTLEMDGLNILMLEKEWIRLTRLANPFRRIAVVEWTGNTLRLVPPLTFGKSNLPIRLLKLTGEEVFELKSSMKDVTLTPPTRELEALCSTVMKLNSVTSVGRYLQNLQDFADVKNQSTWVASILEDVSRLVDWSLKNLDKISVGRDLEQRVHRVEDGRTPCVVLKNNVAQKRHRKKIPLSDFMSTLPTPHSKNYIMYWLARLVIGATVYILTGRS